MIPATKYPIGIETFATIREGGYLYVDKTDYIHTLIEEGQFYFLSRPRRFGKSLLLSTLQAYFEGKRELFEGLDIMKYDNSWERHSVFYLNFLGAEVSESGIRAAVSSALSEWEHEYGICPNTDDLGTRFSSLIRTAADKTGRKVVVLIDEYDRMLVSTLYDNLQLHDTFRTILKPIYGCLKSMDAYIRFAMITGVSRFSRLSIFSDINNLEDISLDRKYSAICGITQTELLKFCHDGLDQFAENSKMSREDVLESLKINYDGYHFSAGAPDIYNPFSLINALKKSEIGQYWYATGTPTFLTRAMAKGDFYIPDLEKLRTSETSLKSSESGVNNPIPILFQAGYLTIKGYEKDNRKYLLGIPNREVESGLYENLLPAYMHSRKGDELLVVDKLLSEINEGKVDDFMKRLKAFLADIPYELTQCKPEIYFENNLYIIFKIIGLYTQVEYRTASGRIDLLVNTPKRVYVMELKLSGSAQMALNQINSKDYLVPFMMSDKEIVKIGISFSKKSRNIAAWKYSCENAK